MASARHSAAVRSVAPVGCVTEAAYRASRTEDLIVGPVVRLLRWNSTVGHCCCSWGQLILTLMVLTTSAHLAESLLDEISKLGWRHRLRVRSLLGQLRPQVRRGQHFDCRLVE